ncbi:hexitol phosphatase HxpB [Patescibacteria group bacterium]|nr:MAG: hexitol phosphatase HxpB [Patescibacteria group bacterium]
MIQAVIFDMDGLLIDSEPLWGEAEKAAFAKVGLQLTDELCNQTIGLRVDQVIDHWCVTFPELNVSKKEVEEDIMQNVLRLVRERGEARPGAKYILDFVKNKKVKMALASSSQLRLIKAVIEKMDIADYFDELYSAEFEEHGKPHPGVYLTVAKVLDVPVQNCLAFEDSFNGLLAAKAARIKCVCVPDETLRGSRKLGIADEVLESLNDFNEAAWERLEN